MFLPLSNDIKCCKCLIRLTVDQPCIQAADREGERFEIAKVISNRARGRIYFAWKEGKKFYEGNANRTGFPFKAAERDRKIESEEGGYRHFMPYRIALGRLIFSGSGIQIQHTFCSWDVEEGFDS